MAEFIFTYRNPADYTPGTPDEIAAWNAWFQGMGSQLRELGKPVFDRATVGDSGDGASTTPAASKRASRKPRCRGAGLSRPAPRWPMEHSRDLQPPDDRWCLPGPIVGGGARL